MKIRRLYLLTMLTAALGAGVVQAGVKVQICHIPPDNPSNYHTITISDKALSAHLGHGDLAGGCSENCDILCDDGDSCTIDACEPGTEICSVDHPPVSCDDGLLCTTDSCDPTDGCQYADLACDDGNACTVDACNPSDGQCTSTPTNCGPLGICVAETGQCDYPCDGISCDPISQCHEPGECVLPGECVDGNPLANGTECDDGDPFTFDDGCAPGLLGGEVTCRGTSLCQVSVPYECVEVGSDVTCACLCEILESGEPYCEWNITPIDCEYPPCCEEEECEEGY